MSCDVYHLSQVIVDIARKTDIDIAKSLGLTLIQYHEKHGCIGCCICGKERPSIFSKFWKLLICLS